jgi:hypothetical protein
MGYVAFAMVVLIVAVLGVGVILLGLATLAPKGSSTQEPEPEALADTQGRSAEPGQGG